MKRAFRQLYITGVTAGLALSLHSMAKAQSPVFDLGIGGQVFQLGDKMVQNGQQFVLPETILHTTQGTVVKVHSLGDMDPILTFSLNFTNILPTTDVITLTESIPVVDCPAGSIVTSTFSESITASASPPGHSVTISPDATLQPIGIDDALVNGTSAGIPLGTTPETFGPGPGTQNFNFAPRTTISPVAVTSLGVSVVFDLTGNSDSATVSGLVLCTVPEPGSISLMLSACVGGSLFMARRLRRRA